MYAVFHLHVHPAGPAGKPTQKLGKKQRQKLKQAQAEAAAANPDQPNALLSAAVQSQAAAQGQAAMQGQAPEAVATNQTTAAASSNTLLSTEKLVQPGLTADTAASRTAVANYKKGSGQHPDAAAEADTHDSNAPVQIDQRGKSKMVVQSRIPGDSRPAGQLHAVNAPSARSSQSVQPTAIHRPAAAGRNRPASHSQADVVHSEQRSGIQKAVAQDSHRHQAPDAKPVVSGFAAVDQHHPKQKGPKMTKPTVSMEAHQPQTSDAQPVQTFASVVAAGKQRSKRKGPSMTRPTVASEAQQPEASHAADQQQLKTKGPKMTNLLVQWERSRPADCRPRREHLVTAWRGMVMLAMLELATI